MYESLRLTEIIFLAILVPLNIHPIKCSLFAAQARKRTSCLHLFLSPMKIHACENTTVIFLNALILLSFLHVVMAVKKNSTRGRNHGRNSTVNCYFKEEESEVSMTTVTRQNIE